MSNYIIVNTKTGIALHTSPGVKATFESEEEARERAEFYSNSEKQFEVKEYDQ